MHSRPLILATRLLKRFVHAGISFVYNIPSLRWLARHVGGLIPDKIYHAVVSFGVPKAVSEESIRAVPESAEWILRALDHHFGNPH